MGRSTRLATAAHIIIYLAGQKDCRVRIDDIAESAAVNPSRLRQLCSRLAQAGYIKSYKGAKGGVKLAQSVETISLLDLCNVVGDKQFFALSPHDPATTCQMGSHIGTTIQKLYENYDHAFQDYLNKTSIGDLIELTQQSTKDAEATK